MLAFCSCKDSQNNRPADEGTPTPPVTEEEQSTTIELLSQITGSDVPLSECVINEQCSAGKICAEGKCIAAEEPQTEDAVAEEQTSEAQTSEETAEEKQDDLTGNGEPVAKIAPCSEEGFTPIPAYSDTDANVHHVDSKYIGKSLGTKEQPWQKISSAADHDLQPGDIVIVHAGTYRETVKIKSQGTAEKPIYFIAEKDADVIIKGSDVIAGWKDEGGGIYSHDGWQSKMPWLPVPESSGYYVVGMVQDKAAIYDKLGTDWNAKIEFLKKEDPDALYSLMRGQVFVDEEPLKEAIVKDKLSAGMFYIDPAASKLYVWLTDSTNPSNRMVEGSKRDGLLIFDDNSKNIGFRGFKVMHATNPLRVQDSVEKGSTYGVVIAGSGHKFEGNEIKYLNGSGLNISGTSTSTKDDRLYKNSVLYAGHVGISSYKALNSIFECNTTAYNGWRSMFLKDNWEHGGMKLCAANGLTVIYHKAYFNIRHGIWFDDACYNNKVINSEVYGHNGIGIDLEHCGADGGSGNTVTENVAYSNKFGIVFNNSRYTAVTNNLFAYNFYAGVANNVGDEYKKTNIVSKNLITNFGLAGIGYNVHGDTTEFTGNQFFKGSFSEYKNRFENVIGEIDALSAPVFLKKALKGELTYNSFVLNKAGDKWFPPIGMRYSFAADSLAIWRRMTDIYSASEQPVTTPQFTEEIRGTKYYYKTTASEENPQLIVGEIKWNFKPDAESIAEDPQFADSPSANFHLKEGSPSFTNGIGPSYLRK
ncbi:MAG: right-handed parallel beta-helix repeat-containing protein [Deltaproteobacteria bacterium]|nr:right-handed parallel beta-helix repeat-containing protein [Deltaproteobacteria bacterium]